MSMCTIRTAASGGGFFNVMTLRHMLKTEKLVPSIIGATLDKKYTHFWPIVPANKMMDDGESITIEVTAASGWSGY